LRKCCYYHTIQGVHQNQNNCNNIHGKTIYDNIVPLNSFLSLKANNIIGKLTTRNKKKDKANEMSVSKKDAAKKNANDSLNKKEKASGKPKGVKEMTMKSKSSKGMKSMSVPGKEKKVSLKENINLWEAFKKNILR
jgi:hypothetical protein